MQIPGMLFQSQSWNSFQKLLGDACLDYYEVHGCADLIDWPRWQTHWPKFRDHLLLSVEELPASALQAPPRSITAAQASARGRANSFNKIINRSAWHEDARSGGLTGKDLARELVLSLGQFADKTSGVPVLLKALGNKLRQAQATAENKPKPQARPADDEADEDDGVLAAFLDAQDAAMAKAQEQEASASPLRARWRQATNWVLKDLRDKVDVARYNEAWASAMVTTRDHMTEHQLHRLRWVDAYLRDLDRFLALGDLVRDHFPAVVGPAWAQRAGQTGTLSMDKLPVADAAETLLAYDRQHQELGEMLRQRLNAKQQHSMLLLQVKTPLHKRGNKFTATPASVSGLITKLRGAAFAVTNTDALERIGALRRDEATGELQGPEMHFADPALCEQTFLKLLQLDSSMWPGDSNPKAEISGKKARKSPTGPVRQIQPSAAMTRKAEKLILSHMETYPLMLQAALLKMLGHGRSDAKTVELLRSKGVFDRLGCEPTLAALDFETLGAANVDLHGNPAPLSAQAFAGAFRDAEKRFGKFIGESAETLMAVQN
jgi:hypothetical protein